ncbi:tripartite tricarboxylate transporter TctB family protein [Chloroflexota bacterium]
MKKRENVYVYLGVTIIALVIICLAMRMETLSSRLLPLVIGCLILVFAITGIGRELLSRGQSGSSMVPDESDSKNDTKESWRSYSFVCAWIVGFIIVIYLLGFLIAIPIFLLLYLKTHGARWRVAISIAGITTGTIYSVFIVALNVHLYKGFLFLNM